MPCLGNAKDHCCYNGRGQPCKFLIENYTDETGYFRRWACSLRAELGDWDKVITDPRYIAEHTWATGLNCRDWPDGEGVNRGVCKECGVNV
jgi:hypothetical protein